MSFISINNISLSFGDRIILDNISFTLSDNSRTALVGGNGTGKTTLMKILSGLIQSDSGSITKSKNMTIGYLPQSDIVLKDNTVYSEIEKGFKYLEDNIKNQHEIEQYLLDNPNAPDTYAQKLHELQEEVLESNYYNRKSIISMTAKGLGIKEKDLYRKCNEFSGGYQMRISLARLLVEKPDLLLLDEPTNYLDIETKLFLQDYINKYNGSVLIVCHDRDFLDNTVNEILELYNNKITSYKGNYSHYETVRKQEFELLIKTYNKQQEDIEKTEKFIERFRYKATKAKQVQSRIKQLDKLERITLPSHLKTLNFRFPEPLHSPNYVVVISGLSKSFGEQNIFKNFSLYVGKGERLAVTGHNGIGKTTLLKIIASKDKDYTGTVKLGTNVKIGYYSQDTADSLDLNLNVLEQVLPFGVESNIRNALGAFMFSGDDIYKMTSVLSGGERARLSLLKILLQPASLLILDEPTNHLDINSKDMLLNALKNYTGTIIFVSHDAYFIKDIATSILYLTDTEKILINGDYDYFEYKLRNMVLPENTTTDKTENDKTNKTDEKEERKFLNKQKNYIQRLNKESESLLNTISNLENEIKDLKEDMNLPENYSELDKINSLVNKLKIIEDEKNKAESRWLQIQEELGKY